MKLYKGGAFVLDLYKPPSGPPPLEDPISLYCDEGPLRNIRPLPLS